MIKETKKKTGLKRYIQMEGDSNVTLLRLKHVRINLLKH